MIRTGKVTGVHENGQIDVQFMRPEACEKCGMCEGAHAHCHEITISGQAQIGDEVDVEMEDKRIPLASMWAYILPLTTLVIGLALSQPLYRILHLTFNADLFAALCALIGVVVGFFVLRLFEPMFKKRQWQPQVVEIRHSSEE